MSDTTVNTEESTPPTPQPPPAPPVTDAPAAEETDWKAEARKWEKLAKQNNKAASELEKVQKAAMSEQEKAVAEAETRGRTAAATEYSVRLAAAEFRAACAAKGVDSDALADLVDASRFLGDDGNVDDTAITAAVDKLAKLAPSRGPGRSGGDFGGAPTPPPASLDEQIAEAQKNRDVKRVISLKRQRAASST
ncbi:hypothetical protein [Stackebrandtia soli]|uniref:hypothetical protein n=1 Tax=Stackebrandtia soli TaxID=1892856 RepID=UPI0039EB45E4